MPRETERRSHWWLGILPFIGVILFLIDLGFLLAGRARGAWLHHLIVESAVTDIIGWAGVGAGVSHLFFGKQISKSFGFETNPCGFEVGVRDLSFGIVGLMAASCTLQSWRPSSGSVRSTACAAASATSARSW